MKNPSRFLMAAPALLALLQVGCVNVELEGLATAECVEASDCQAGATCVSGACVACGAETCDGADNDCDGVADEGFDFDSDADHCGGCGNVCEGVCRAGACVPDACTATEEVCNGADDDCDGTTDEGTLNACDACGPVPEETCDGADDDCDGTTDEGTLNACGACGPVPMETCNGADDDCDGSLDEGVLNACGRCGEAPAEACNGVDDDCDGATDEGFVGLDGPCSAGAGVCATEGTWGCTPDGTDVVCSAVVLPAGGPERCGDGLDNDCDGTTDEGFAVGEACAVGVGACRSEGTTVCDGEGLATVCGAVEGAGVEEACNGLDDDCDGATDEAFDLQSDPANCGACGQVCALPNATATCGMGACAVLDCAPDFGDVDALPDNGCECAVGRYDAPDAEALDANCDGIDGTLARSIFVSALHGADNAAGTPDAPVQTLAAALQRVDANRTDVLLSAEDHALTGDLVLEGTVRLAGGYTYTPGLPPEQAWSRDLAPGAPRTRLLRADGSSPALAVAVEAEVDLAALDIGFAEGPLTVASPVAVFARSCARLSLEGVVLRVPRGVAGPPGRTGDDARDTADAGADGREGGIPIGESAAGGVNRACPDLTAGGAGGVARVVGGTDGEASEGGAGGGLGADSLGEDRGDPGEDGRAGRAGRSAVAVEGGGRVDAARLIWIAPRFTEAEAGSAGIGGGGGGGSFTFGGGGGGAAGCPGTGAGNGLAGGASIGLVVPTACALSVRDGLVVTAGGAEGGDAGAGGLGGPGGPGGSSDRAGPGGQGGPGGCGGHGAPGAGGPTVGVLLVGPPTESPALDARFELGPPGAAGAPVGADHPCGPGPVAADGQQLEVACCVDPQACGADLRCAAP